MNLENQFRIKNNSLLQKYIRKNSYWYKILNRNPNMIEYLEEEMKEKYKLTTADKINDLSNKLDLVRAFMDAFK